MISGAEREVDWILFFVRLTKLIEDKSTWDGGGDPL